MKKFLVVLVLATLVTGGAFAQISLSAGAGLNLGVMSTSYSEGDSPDPQIGFGFHGFFDATYAVAKVGVYINSEKDPDFTVTYLSIGLLGKFPIDVGSFKIFPMLGFEYLMFLQGAGDGDTVSRADMLDIADEFDMDIDAFILQLGVGADFNINDSIYIRPFLLWGVDLTHTKTENDVTAFVHKLDVGVSVGFKF